MGGRIFKFLLAVWWLAWSCVIVPAHTRGAIGVDGQLARRADGSVVSFFLSSVPSCCQEKSESGEKSSPSSSSVNCAICMIVANTGFTADLPPVVDAPRELVFSFLPETAQVLSGDFLPHYHGRAPPA